MTISDQADRDAALCVDLHDVAPPLAPLAMPKQVLRRRSRPLWRGFGAVLSLLRRDLGRAG
ncbi:MAG: hypothetical protein ACK4HF_04075 [Paracoccaceae bacterium]